MTTRVYMGDEKEYALNMPHFEAWSKKSGIPWRAIKPHLESTLEKARALWPKSLEELPMDARFMQEVDFKAVAISKKYRLGVKHRL